MKLRADARSGLVTAAMFWQTAGVSNGSWPIQNLIDCMKAMRERANMLVLDWRRFYFCGKSCTIF